MDQIENQNIRKEIGETDENINYIYKAVNNKLSGHIASGWYLNVLENLQKTAS